MRIDPADNLYTLIVVMDLEPDQVGEVLDITASRCEEFIRYLPGFVGASWLTRTAMMPGGDGAARDGQHSAGRIVEYLQWRSRAHHRSFMADPVGSSHIPKVAQHITSKRYDSYQLAGSVCGPGGVRLDQVGQPVSGLIIIDPVEGKQGWVAEYNLSETMRLIRHFDGFVSASFHLAHDSERVVEYVQWVSEKAFAAAASDAAFLEHIRVVGHYAAVDVGVYHLARAVEAPDRRPSASLTASGPASAAIPAGQKP
jgi:hypothetical protein